MKRCSKILIFLCLFCAGIAAWGYWRFNQPSLMLHGKGGVGIVAENVFVFTDGDTNEIEWHFDINGTKRWKGKSRDQQKVVIFDGSEVRPFAWSALLKFPLVIRFTPGRINGYDLSDFKGIYYLRVN